MRVSIIGTLSKPALVELRAGTATPPADARARAPPRALRPRTESRGHGLRPRAACSQATSSPVPRSFKKPARRRAFRRGVRAVVDAAGHLVLTVEDHEPRSRTPTTDPITAEIIRNALIAITDEMKTNMMRTAYNPIIYEAFDFTVGLFDAAGDTTSIGLGTADVHPRTLRRDQGEARNLTGRDGIEPWCILCSICMNEERT